jgi:hypothetical protein
MRLNKIKIRNRFVIVMVSLAALAVIIIVILSPLAKYLVEKYDTKILGREVKVHRIYINPFTGLVSITDLKIFEHKKDTVFFSAKSVEANFSVRKLFFDEYEISDLNINDPTGYIIQKKKALNFDDIIKRFTPTDSSNSGSPTHFSILRFKITNGEFHYREKIIPIDYSIRKVKMEGSGFRWDADTIAAAFYFESANRNGIASGNFTINVRNQDYRLTTSIRDFDLELIRQYLWELINYGMFRAKLQANIKASGNFKSINDINLKGRLAIEDFHLGKTVDEDYTSFKRLSLVIDELSPMHKKYFFDSVTLDHPFILFERFDSLDNVQAMFGKEAKNISDVTSQPERFNLVIQISRYIESLSKSFFASQYRINSLAVTNADLNFSDYSLSQQFSLRARNFTLKADSITKINKRVKFFLTSQIFPYGNLSATLSMNPLDSGDLDLLYKIEKLPVTVFNPYFISYTSYPLDKGTIQLNGNWKVRHGNIKSTNHLVLIDPRIAGRIKAKDGKWIPLPIIMAFVRERGNIIDYKIPISGNLKNPKFHLRDVIIDLFENIFIKPPTLPYGLEVSTAEKSIASSVAISWKIGQSKLENKQARFIKQMAKFLKRNKEASIDIYPQQFAVKEKEQILFFETRKKYFLLTQKKNGNTFSTQDSVEVENISIKKIAKHLTKDLTTITRDTTMFTIQDKCSHFLGDNTVALVYEKLLKARQNSLKSILLEQGVEKQVTMHADENVIPHDGFSIFRIEYNGAMPKSLKDSYDKLFKLNNRSLRKKYFKSGP